MSVVRSVIRTRAVTGLVVAARALIAIAIAMTMVMAMAGCGADEGPGTQADGAGAGLERAPDFELTLFGNDDHEAGETIRLSQFEGQPVVLNFWFPSCPPCVAEMPDFEVAYQQFRGQGVQFIGVQLVGLDTVEDGQQFVRKLGVNYLLGPDKIGDSMGGIVMAYSVSGFPTTVFIDKDQNIKRRWSGAMNLEKLEELIREIM